MSEKQNRISPVQAREMSEMAVEGIHAGFPSPAQDYMEGCIDLNRELVKHPNATFYGRVVGDSMVEAGVDEGDILVIDKSLEPCEGDMAVCFVDGEFTLKYISFKDPAGNRERIRHPMESPKAPVSYNILHTKDLWLLPANPSCCPIHIAEGNDFTIWGIVTYIIKKIHV